MRELWHFLVHWAEIGWMAAVCLCQEAIGHEPDCPQCWKCEMMRVLLLCVMTFVVVKLGKALFYVQL